MTSQRKIILKVCLIIGIIINANFCFTSCDEDEVDPELKVSKYVVNNGNTIVKVISCCESEKTTYSVQPLDTLIPPVSISYWDSIYFEYGEKNVMFEKKELSGYEIIFQKVDERIENKDQNHVLVREYYDINEQILDSIAAVHHKFD